MQDRLSLDWLAKNLFPHTYPMPAAELSLSHLMLAGIFQWCCMCSHLVVFEMHTSTAATVVKYSVQKWSLTLNRNYSYTKSLYNILHGRNAIIGNFIGSIVTVKCHAKQWFIALKQNYVPQNWCWTKRILKERCTDWRKTSWHWCSIRSKLKEIIPSFGSSVCIKSTVSVGTKLVK
jgi:hypothetical protein